MSLPLPTENPLCLNSATIPQFRPAQQNLLLFRISRICRFQGRTLFIRFRQTSSFISVRKSCFTHLIHTPMFISTSATTMSMRKRTGRRHLNLQLTYFLSESLNLRQLTHLHLQQNIYHTALEEQIFRKYYLLKQQFF